MSELEKGHSEYIKLSNISPTPIMVIERRDYKTGKLEDKLVIQVKKEER